MPQLLLYTTLGCHLCEQAKALAQPLAQRQGLTLTEVEIADDPTLMEAYGIRIPVLQRDSGAELGWPFTAGQLQDWLNSSHS